MCVSLILCAQFCGDDSFLKMPPLPAYLATISEFSESDRTDRPASVNAACSVHFFFLRCQPFNVKPIRRKQRDNRQETATAAARGDRGVLSNSRAVPCASVAVVH